MRHDAASVELLEAGARKWLAVLLILSVAGVLSHRLPLVADVRLSIEAPLAPVLGGVNILRHELFILAGRHRSTVERETLVEAAENVYLAEELARLRRENSTLREQAALDPAAFRKGMIASVIAKPFEPAQGDLTIDRGLSHGVREGSVVVASTNGTLAVVGVVDTIGERTARIRSIWDPACRIAVSIAGSETVDIYSGTSAGRPGKVEYVDRARVIKNGAPVLTASSSSLFPAGFRVGAVTSVGAGADRYQDVVVTPEVSRKDLYYVWVLGDES